MRVTWWLGDSWWAGGVTLPGGKPNRRTSELLGWTRMDVMVPAGAVCARREGRVSQQPSARLGTRGRGGWGTRLGHRGDGQQQEGRVSPGPRFPARVTHRCRQWKGKCTLFLRMGQCGTDILLLYLPK